MKIVSIAALCSCLLLGGLGAQTALTVDMAVESALGKNITLKRDRLASDALGRKSSVSWNGFLPVLTAGAGLSRGNADADRTTYGLLTATVSASPALVAAMDKARLEHEASLTAYNTSRRDIELLVRKNFFALMYERENVELQRNSVETAEKQYEQTQRNYRSGLVPELDVLSAQVNLENLRPNLTAALVSFDNNLASFKQLIGVDQTEDIVLEGSLEAALGLGPVDQSASLSESPGVTGLESALRVAIAAQRQARYEATLPSVSLSWSYRPTRNSAGPDTWNDTGSATAAVTLPLDGLFPWSVRGSKISAAEDTVADTVLALESERITASLKRRSLANEIERAVAAVKARRLNIVLAERRYEMTEEAYRRGAKDLLALQDASDALQVARVSMMKDSYGLIAAVLELEYETGVPFGSLGRDNEKE